MKNLSKYDNDLAVPTKEKVILAMVKIVQATLPASAWDSATMQQSIVVDGISADETKQRIEAAPVSSMQDAYYEAGVWLRSQAANFLTFTCDTIPTDDINILVSIQEAAI